MRLRNLAVMACALLLLSVPRTGSAQNRNTECYATAYRSYAAAQRAYQQRVVEIAVARAPQLEGVAQLLARHQISLSEARAYVVLMMLRQARHTLQLDRRVNEWLDWSPDERGRLAATDTAYARLVQQSERVQAQIASHPRLAEAQSLFANQVAPSAEHQQAVATLTATANQASAACRLE